MAWNSAGNPNGLNASLAGANNAWSDANRQIGQAVSPYMDQWGNAIVGTQAGAAKYLADAEAKNTAAQRELAGNVQQLQLGGAAQAAGRGPAAGRAAIYGGANAGARGIAQSDQLRAQEVAGAQQLGVNTNLAAGSQFGAQAGQALNQQIAGMNYGTGVQGLTQNSDAAAQAMMMQGIGAASSGIGAGMAMSDENSKEVISDLRSELASYRDEAMDKESKLNNYRKMFGLHGTERNEAMSRYFGPEGRGLPPDTSPDTKGQNVRYAQPQTPGYTRYDATNRPENWGFGPTVDVVSSASPNVEPVKPLVQQPALVQQPVRTPVVDTFNPYEQAVPSTDLFRNKNSRAGINANPAPNPLAQRYFEQLQQNDPYQSDERVKEIEGENDYLKERLSRVQKMLPEQPAPPNIGRYDSPENRDTLQPSPEDQRYFDYENERRGIDSEKDKLDRERYRLQTRDDFDRMMKEPILARGDFKRYQEEYEDRVNNSAPIALPYGRVGGAITKGLDTRMAMNRDVPDNPFKFDVPDNAFNFQQSDEKVKKASTSVLTTELRKRFGGDLGRKFDDLLDRVDPKEWRYKTGMVPKALSGAIPQERKRPGITAQDLEKSELGNALVIETPTGKAVDTAGLAGAAMASAAHLNKKIKRLEGRYS